MVTTPRYFYSEKQLPSVFEIMGKTLFMSFVTDARLATGGFLTIYTSEYDKGLFADMILRVILITFSLHNLQRLKKLLADDNTTYKKNSTDNYVT